MLEDLGDFVRFGLWALRFSALSLALGAALLGASALFVALVRRICG
jgi:hypothetical protein